MADPRSDRRHTVSDPHGREPLDAADERGRLVPIQHAAQVQDALHRPGVLRVLTRGRGPQVGDH
jgi:hypothetical protein